MEHKTPNDLYQLVVLLIAFFTAVAIAALWYNYG
jgi:hypothetical protein